MPKQLSLNKHRWGHPACGFFKYSIHVLQALMMTVCVFLYKLRKQLNAASKMQKAKKLSRLEKAVAAGCIVGIPLVCLIATFALEEDQLYVRVPAGH